MSTRRDGEGTEKAFRESEERFRSLVQNSSDVITILDAEGTIIYDSPAVERVLGYKPEERIGTDVFDQAHPDGLKQEAARIFGEVVASPGTNLTLEFPWPHKDGSLLYLEVTLTNLLDDPAVRGIVCNWRDITEIKAAEETLRRSEEQFRSSFRDAAIGMALVGTDGHWLQVNHSLCEMLGYSEEELLEKTFQDITHPDDLEADLDHVRQMLSGEIETYQMQKRYFHADGHVVWILLSVSMVHDQDEKPLFFVAQIQDITERKEAEERLREAEERYRTLVETVPAVIYTDRAAGSDPNVAVYTSPQIETLVGYSLQEWLEPERNLWEERLHPEDRAWVLAADERSRATGEPFAEEYRLIAKDGRVVWVRDEAALMRSEAGEPLYWQGVLMDVTDRKEAEEALRESEERYRAVMEQSVEAIYLFDAQTKRILESNAAFRRLMGYTEVELLGMRIYEFIDHEAEDIDRHVGRSLQLRQRHIGERRYRRKDGSVIVVDTSASVISYGGRTALCAVSRDVTERRQAEETMRRSEARLAEAQRLAHLGGWEWDIETDEISWSDEVYRIYGFAPQSVVPSVERFMAVVHPEDRDLIERVIDGALYDQRPYDIEHRVVRPDGEVRVVHRQAEVVRGEGGEALRMIGTVHDITERKEAEGRLRQAEERYRNVVEEQTELVCRFAPDLTLTFVNDAYCRYFGVEPEEAIGESFIERVPVEDRVYYEKLSARLNDENPRRTVEHQVLMPDGKVRWQQWTDTAILDGEGRIAEYQSVGRDVTERKALEERLEHQAFHDSLTDLPNRALFVDRLEQALRRTRRQQGRGVAVLFMDLDEFKVVNDSLGHEAGDLLLTVVAQRLGRCLRPDDTLARFGGDEFVVLIEDVKSPEDAVRVAERILRALSEPFLLQGRELFATVSIGVALGGTRWKRSEDLLRDADTAMYEAKSEAVSGYRVFDPAMHERVVGRLELENDLRRAVEAGEFVVHYQPILQLDDGHLRGVEALVRWEHPERGLLNPDEFVPVAEEGGLIVPIGEGVLREACLRAKAWQEKHPRIPPLVMSVNLSAGQLSRPDLAETVEGILRETGLEGSYLTLDVTETVYVKALEANTIVLNRLRDLGVRFSIDDFGTGYSSLAYLKMLPADALKIDKTFVEGLGNDVEDTAIVTMVVGLAHTLGMEVIAEGVESEEQARLLREMGCDMAQGYYFAKPLPPDAASRFLAE